ncbi:helix-turn-helix transcriptional regulator [Chitinophaga sp. RAB17]|jgi:transcriptional regulator with XRE-family HTH domain|uniref:helix-turn-helix transcriptional regulator n=1 Tax=Chitinophaga sp. RAB17 TaxID=3233049 RepID=UPI003F8E4413
MEGKLKINRIKAVLADKDIKQKDLAEMIGKTPSAVTRMCNNNFQPTLKVLRDIAIALDVSMCELLIDPRKEKK